MPPRRQLPRSIHRFAHHLELVDVGLSGADHTARESNSANSRYSTGMAEAAEWGVQAQAERWVPRMDGRDIALDPDRKARLRS